MRSVKEVSEHQASVRDQQPLRTVKSSLYLFCITCDFKFIKFCRVLSVFVLNSDFVDLQGRRRKSP